eukprot:GEMP01022404.1.p1 GENE.GEMP01022404.1~~GEMP01022404.1.p1  ORF type:complete len:585 (+),score=164.74 GEMP01022404.1:203-1957(+)
MSSGEGGQTPPSPKTKAKGKVAKKSAAKKKAAGKSSPVSSPVSSPASSPASSPRHKATGPTPTEDVPIFMPDTVVEMLIDSPLYRSPNMGGSIESIPEGTVIKIDEQDAKRPYVCLTHFAGKIGYVRIIDDKGSLCIAAAEKCTVAINNNEEVPGFVRQFNLTEGTIVEALGCLLLRTGESKSTDLIEELAEGTQVVVLRIGHSKRLRVRGLHNKDLIGWISSTSDGDLPLVGYRLCSSDNTEYEVGARLEVKVTTRLTAEHDVESVELDGGSLKPGTVVIVEQIGPGKQDEKKIRVQTETTKMSGWIFVMGRKGEPTLGTVGGTGSKMGPYATRWFDAAKGNNPSVMIDLVGKGKSLFTRLAEVPDVNVVDSRGKTALHYACGYGNHDVVVLLLSQKIINVHMKDDFSRVALHYCCRRFPGAPMRDQAVYKKLCKMLLGAKALVDEADDNGATPLMYACFRGDYDIAKYLISDAGADITRKTNVGSTAMQMAALQKQRKICDLLIKNGAPKEDLELMDDSDESEWEYEYEEEEEPVSPTASPKTKAKAKVKGKIKAKAKGKKKAKAKSKKATAKAALQAMMAG